MKHILIPTDFSISSLQAVHSVVAQYPADTLRITLFHLRTPASDISALYRSLRNKHMAMVTEDFQEACQIMQNRYSSKIKVMRVEFGFGTTVAYLNNLLEGLKVDEILICPELKMEYGKDSIDPVPLLRKSRWTVVSMALTGNQRNIRSTDSVNLLAGNEMKVSQKKMNYATEK